MLGLFVSCRVATYKSQARGSPGKAWSLMNGGVGLAPSGENERETAMVCRARTLPSTVTLMGEELNARGRAAAANRRAGFTRVRSVIAIFTLTH